MDLHGVDHGVDHECIALTGAVHVEVIGEVLGQHDEQGEVDGVDAFAKQDALPAALQAALARVTPDLTWFSLLRPLSELLIARLFRDFDFHIEAPDEVRPAARLTTRPARQVMCRVTRRA